MRKRFEKRELTVLAALAACAISGPALAGELVVSSYDTPNGDGTAAGGTYNYWDGNYSGSGSKTTDGAALTGGVGALTDGVISSNFWYNVSNTAGTGPYVGWFHGDNPTVTPDPTVTFHFSGAPTINEIKIYVDNSGVGGVVSPASILIDGVNRPFSGPASGTVGLIDFTGLNLTGGLHTIRFYQPNTSDWTFVSEVDFFGGSVPEPATWSLMLAGFGGLGAALRSRRRPATAAS